MGRKPPRSKPVKHLEENLKNVSTPGQEPDFKAHPVSKAKAFVAAARLRTLPLSISGIIVGSALTIASGQFNWLIFVLALLTTIGFQVLSNFANDYGDGVKGTDANRTGEQRMVASGVISPAEMKKAVQLTAIVSFLLAVTLIYVAFGKEHIKLSLLFFVLGIAALAAAVKYTVGKGAYGYSGFGDIFVFVFFGLVGVLGSYFLYAKSLNLQVFFPAFTVGLLSVAVLNLNNMRDEENDKRSGKNTLVVRIGGTNAKLYHLYLIFAAMISALAFLIFSYRKPSDLLFLLAFIPLLLHVKRVYTIRSAEAYDPELKKVALSTFLFSILLAIGQIL